jgi:hypothetical protein
MPSGSEKLEGSDTTQRYLRNIVRKIFLEDWLLKLIALAITIGLWLGVTGLTTNSTKRLTVKLVPNVANNVKVTNNLIAEVDIVVSGDERKLKNLSGSVLDASLDLTEVPLGERVVSLSPQNVAIPGLDPGIKLDEVQPRRIAVTLEQVEEIELPITPNIEGTAAPGFEVYGVPTFTPSRVRVRGTVSVLRMLQSASTEPISIEGRRSDLFARQVRVTATNENAIVLDPVVDVIVKIGEIRIEKTMTIPVMGNLGKKAVVTLYGPKTVLESIRPDALKVEMVKTDSGQETPQLNLPAELQNSVEVRKIKASGQ